MADAIKKYTLGRSRLERGCASGFAAEAGGVLRADPNQPQRSLFLGRLDSGSEDYEWGRLSFKAEVDAEMALIVRAFATSDLEFIAEGEATGYDSFLLDAARPLRHKRQLFEAAGGVKDSEHGDVLLYGQQGRYLYIAIELLGEGEGALRDICVWAPGENFLATFPEVYRSDSEFFRRYLTIFSAMYNDMQERLDRLDEVIDIEKAPRELLDVFAEWMGIAPARDLLDTAQLRRYLGMGFALIQGKGTRGVLERLMDLLLGEGRAYVVENTCAEGLARGGGAESAGREPYDLVVLVNLPSDEGLHARLHQLVGMFRPLRCRVDIVFIGGQNAFDAYCCLDINAAIGVPAAGGLDSRVILNGTTYLE